ncbi:hypothetical protein L596_016103 [Steinernema carpocapsae]|uniref:Uncharacterized protein n=1 Tax=Steinernema carpocapsae TaxID=34508 RepID=A0A4U5NHT3_STECR|nr:hypothetical protein L596_016103 [Steinernema carpocapsae]
MQLLCTLHPSHWLLCSELGWPQRSRTHTHSQNERMNAIDLFRVSVLCETVSSRTVKVLGKVCGIFD